eukprot:scaffold6100_cov129-Isochrysis_galbana.AAC.4
MRAREVRAKPCAASTGRAGTPTADRPGARSGVARPAAAGRRVSSSDGRIGGREMRRDGALETGSFLPRWPRRGYRQ